MFSRCKLSRDLEVKESELLFILRSIFPYKSLSSLARIMLSSGNLFYRFCIFEESRCISLTLKLHYFEGIESDRKLLSSTEMITASSYKNWASNLLIQSLFSLKFGSLYFVLAAWVFPYLRWNLSHRIFWRVVTQGTFRSLHSGLVWAKVNK